MVDIMKKIAICKSIANHIQIALKKLAYLTTTYEALGTNLHKLKHKKKL
jgi:hypothetical protein